MLLLAATLCLLGGCRHDTFPQVPVGFREFAYVANYAGHSVTVLDTVNMRPERTLDMKAAPVALAVNPVADEVYVVLAGAGDGDGSIAVIDSAHNSVAATLRVGRRPLAIAVDPSGEHAYVANSGSNSVTVLDLKARRVVATEAVGQAPGALAVAPDGRSLVVANAGSGSVSVFGLPAASRSERAQHAGTAAQTGADAAHPGAATAHGDGAVPGDGAGGDGSPATITLRATFAGCPGATAAVVLPDSSRAFVACAGARRVLSLNLAAAPGSWPARQDATLLQDRALALLEVGDDPTELTVKGDGGEVFVSNRMSDSVSEIAATTDEVGSTYPIGDRPGAGLVSTDGSALWIADSGASSLSLYSIDDGKLLSSVHTGLHPAALAFAAGGQLVLSANRGSGDVSLIRTNSKLGPALFDMLPAGAEPVAIVTKSNAKSE